MALRTIADAAAVAGTSTRTVERAISSGELQAVKLGRLVRIRDEAIVAWIKRTPARPDETTL